MNRPGVKLAGAKRTFLNGSFVNVPLSHTHHLFFLLPQTEKPSHRYTLEPGSVLMLLISQPKCIVLIFENENGRTGKFNLLAHLHRTLSNLIIGIHALSHTHSLSVCAYCLKITQGPRYSNNVFLIFL